MSQVSRDRIFYQSKAFFASTGNATGAFSDGQGNNYIKQLHRIQSIGTSVNIPRHLVNQMGELGAIDRIIIEQPTTNLDFSYLLTNAYNESLLGLNVDGTTSIISGLLQNAKASQDFFILITPEGEDAVGWNGDPSTNRVRAIGNGFLSAYNVEAAVGQPPKATVTVEALNAKFDMTSSGASGPAINPANGVPISQYTYVIPAATSGQANQVALLRPGELTVSITSDDQSSDVGYGVDIQDAKIQSFRLNVPLTREPLAKLGSLFAFSRVFRFPIEVSADINIMLGELGSGALSDVLCNDKTYTVQVDMKKPNCSGNGVVALSYVLKGVKIDSQNFAGSIGPNDSLDIKLSVPLQGPQDTTRGLFVSGIVNES